MPSILSNSFTLFVTRIMFFDLACAEINKSIGPIILPIFSNPALILPNSIASLSLKLRILNIDRNSMRAILFLSINLFFSAPYCSSATVVIDRGNAPIGPLRAFATRGCLEILPLTGADRVPQFFTGHWGG